MTKDSDGVWSTTIGPLEPSIYIYWFTVDGLAIADPVNPRVKLRARTSASLVEVPAQTPDFWQPHDVPHGAVTINWQKSQVLNETRWVWVYTPPGYQKETKRLYPVLYLFHGSNDTAAGWTMVGYANFVLDNLLTEKKTVPMIVVMPFGHAVPFGSPPEVQAKNTPLFEEYLLQDVIPFVESTYRVAAGRENRAIAGLSMGGGQTLRVVTTHPDQFAYVGVWSAGIFGDATQFEERNTAFLGQADKVNELVKLFSISVGDKDFLLAGSRSLSETLSKHGIKNELHVSGGGHTWINWRRYLNEFAPKLFR